MNWKSFTLGTVVGALVVGVPSCNRLNSTREAYLKNIGLIEQRALAVGNATRDYLDQFDSKIYRAIRPKNCDVLENNLSDSYLQLRKEVDKAKKSYLN